MCPEQSVWDDCQAGLYYVINCLIQVAADTIEMVSGFIMAMSRGY